MSLSCRKLLPLYTITSEMGSLPFKITDKQAIIFIGIQASGKTTFYERVLSDGTYSYISLDEHHTRHQEDMAISACLEQAKSFVIDNTNPEICDRKRYIQRAKEHGCHVIGIFFQSIVIDCVGRNEGRGMKVHSKAIACTSNKLQMPSKIEGFDELYFVRIDNDDFEISTWRE